MNGRWVTAVDTRGEGKRGRMLLYLEKALSLNHTLYLNWPLSPSHPFLPPPSLPLLPSPSLSLPPSLSLSLPLPLPPSLPPSLPPPSSTVVPHQPWQAPLCHARGRQKGVWIWYPWSWLGPVYQRLLHRHKTVPLQWGPHQCPYCQKTDQEVGSSWREGHQVLCNSLGVRKHLMTSILSSAWLLIVHLTFTLKHSLETSPKTFLNLLFYNIDWCYFQIWSIGSLVPRPHPAFCCLQYGLHTGKAWERG